MINLNFEQCLNAAGESTQYGYVTRTQASIFLPLVEKVAQVSRYHYQDAIWGSLTVEVEPGQALDICFDNAQIENFCTHRGWLIRQANRVILLPAPPRLLALDPHQRIQRWHDLGWQVSQRGAQLTLHPQPALPGLVELIWLQSAPETVQLLFNPHPLEQKTWAVEGCWSKLTGPSEFWRFLALGNIYSGRFGQHGRFPSAQTGWSLYKIAAVLGSKTGKLFYSQLMAHLAYTALAALGKDGAWANGEWLTEPETHLRFQLDGIHLLLSAYQQFGDPALLGGAERAADFVLAMNDDLANSGWWFLHDTLELDEASITAHYPRMLRHQAFGKARANTLALNTHLSALHVLYRLAQISPKPKYHSAYRRGMAALEWTLASTKGGLIHRLAGKLLKLSFENQPASPLRRAVRSIIRRSIIDKLTIIQKYWPRFATPNGYLWRDMTLPGWGYWYHLVNLYDLLLLYQLDPQPWLYWPIQQAMSFTRQSNLLPYLVAQNHYIVPQWLQILKACQPISPMFNAEQIRVEIERLTANGYGLPPELYTPSGSFLMAEVPTAASNGRAVVNHQSSVASDIDLLVGASHG